MRRSLLADLIGKVCHALAEAVDGRVETADFLFQVTFLPLEVGVAASQVIYVLAQAFVDLGQLTDLLLEAFNFGLKTLILVFQTPHFRPEAAELPVEIVEFRPFSGSFVHITVLS